MVRPDHRPENATSDATSSEEDATTITLRQPVAGDGADIHRLIAACPPLDTNSLYCNLLQATHFAQTCILAERNGQAVGWISGYVPPNDPHTLFVWQVAVHEAARGQGLGRRMLQGLLDRPALARVRHIQTTITPSNQASWALFQGFAKARGASLSHEAHFHRDRHFDGAHETEHMVSITLPKAAVAA